MKKLRLFSSLVLVIMLLTSNLVSAQRRRGFAEGQSDLNLGIGFVTFGLKGDVTVPPVSISYEYGISDNIGVGLFAVYTASSFDFGASFGVTGAPEIQYTYGMFAARGSYHFKLLKGLDTYAGLMVGYNKVTVDYDKDDFNGMSPSLDLSGIIYGFHAGGRYHFTKNLGAFLEIGYGVSAVNLGLTAKF
ncbi:MAG: hypothetical protein EP346_13490 [Bacteroidetes bacterium]|nr:MAG: hypothetical protein EP346_13490 [Bacteroidota bacterium]